MKTLIACAFLILSAGAVHAQPTTDGIKTFLVTGTVIQNPYGNPGWGTPGDILEFEYTVNPLITPDPGSLSPGPITAMAYSVNGGAFIPYNGYGGVDLTSGTYGFLLYPGNGAVITYDPNAGTMLEYGKDGFGNYAKVTSFQQILPASAPEIDPAGLASGLTLLLGSLFVIQGRRSCTEKSTR